MDVFTLYVTCFSAIDWEYLAIGNDHYLIVSNAQNGGSAERLKSVIYRWQGVEQFVPIHSLTTLPNADYDVFFADSETFLVYAGAKSPISEVLKLKLV